MRHVIFAALLAATPGLLASCGHKETPAPTRARPHVMVFVPKLEGSIVVDTTGTEETERLTMVVPVSGDSVANFYRHRLPPIGWRIRNDNTTDTSLTDLYAVGPQGPDQGPTLWIHVEHQDPRSARYTLIVTFPAAMKGTATAPRSDTARP